MGHWGTCPLEFDASFFSGLTQSVCDCHHHFFKVENNKKYQFFLILWARESYFFLLPEVFCGLKYAENAIAAGAPPWIQLGELTTLPQTPSRLGSGHPSPYPTPLGVFGASMLAPSAPRSSCPPDTKSWRRHCICTHISLASLNVLQPVDLFWC